MKIEADTYKAKYSELKDENEELRIENRMLRERMGIIAQTTNMLMPISSIITTAEQILKLIERERPLGTPNTKKRRLNIEPRRSNQPPETRTDEIPIFTLDPKYPQITQSLLRSFHKAAESKKYIEGSSAPESQIRDRVFVRLLFNKIFEIEELIGRCTTGNRKRNGKPWGGKEIDPDKKRFIKEKLRERLEVIDPQNVNVRSRQNLLHRFYAALLRNRIASMHSGVYSLKDKLTNIRNNNESSKMNDENETSFEILDEPVKDDDEEDDYEGEPMYENDIDVEVLPKVEPS